MTTQFGAMTRLNRSGSDESDGSSGSVQRQFRIPMLDSFDIEDFVVFEDGEDVEENETEGSGKGYSGGGGGNNARRRRNRSESGSNGCPLMALLDDLEDLVLPSDLSTSSNIHMSTMMPSLQASSSFVYGMDQKNPDRDSSTNKKMESTDAGTKVDSGGNDAPPQPQHNRLRPRVEVGYE